MANQKNIIGVIGGGDDVDKSTFDAAFETGRLVAERGAVLVCGGLGGVMEAAAKGASEAGGTVIGILPSGNKNDANPFVTIAIPTGMGMGRNILVVQTADVLIAFPGSYGTLSEIGLALNSGKPVIYLPGVWNLSKAGKVDGNLFKEAFDPAQAVALALSTMAR
jgi:uncharacterized protein (TIGR00725 family)